MDVVKARLVVLLLFVASGLSACGYPTSAASEKIPATSKACTSSAVANQYVVRWKDGTSVVYKNTTREQILKTIIEPNVDEIEFAEQDQKVRAPATSLSVTEQATVPASPDWGQAITEAQSAWDQGYRGKGVIVAVVDSGVDRTHNQLRNQIYVNPGETGLDSQGRDKATNGVDDDHNGFIDDVSGYDFEKNSAFVTDGTGHGTHVAGVIAAQQSAGSVKGLADQARILPLDFMTDDGSGNISDAIRAMAYAAQMGAKVVNASWGGSPCSRNLQSAIADLGARGIIFVSAAGNNGVDLDEQPEYPAAYGMSSQVTVGASSTRDFMEIFSNFSYSLVNIMAPGSGIVSTYPDLSTSTTKRTDLTKSLSGTSMAAPFVSGAAALLLGARPNATVSDVKNALLLSVDSGPFQVSSRGRLNVRKALVEILKLPQ